MGWGEAHPLGADRDKEKAILRKISNFYPPPSLFQIAIVNDAFFSIGSSKLLSILVIISRTLWDLNFRAKPTKTTPQKQHILERFEY